MYALDAKTGKIVWEFYLVPKAEGDTVRGPQGATPLDTSTWKNPSGIPITGGGTWTSYTLDPTTGQLYVPGGNPAPDFAIGPREGDESLFRLGCRARRQDRGLQKPFQARAQGLARLGRLHPADLIQTGAASSSWRSRPRMDTSMASISPPTPALSHAGDPDRKCRGGFSPGKAVHFCPGPVGGAEWNSPAYDPQTNLIIIGEVDWCDTVTLQSDDKLRSVAVGQPWSAMATINPFNMYGKEDLLRGLGRMGLRRRRGHRRLEVAAEVQLPDLRRP